jgi:hypothetical protein
MHWLRRPSVPGLLLAFLMGVGLLLPEMAHGFAHHHDAEHEASHPSKHAPMSGSSATSGSHGSDHPHLDLTGTPSAKPSFGKAIVVQHAVPVFRECETQHAQLPAIAAAMPPGGRDHGPPPPSRAPPFLA